METPGMPGPLRFPALWTLALHFTCPRFSPMGGEKHREQRVMGLRPALSVPFGPFWHSWLTPLKERPPPPPGVSPVAGTAVQGLPKAR